MTDTLYSLANNIFKALNAKGGCALMLAVLCVWLAYKDYNNRMMNQKNHEIHLEMVGELREISTLLIGCKKQSLSSLTNMRGQNVHASRERHASDSGETFRMNGFGAIK